MTANVAAKSKRAKKPTPANEVAPQSKPKAKLTSRRGSRFSTMKPKGIIGEVVVIDLESVEPNDWNPNEMNDFEFSALKFGMATNGWLKSDSMLIWGTDEKGVAQNKIIDGEHRWGAAREIGMAKGPAVILNGITRSRAIAWTIELDNKRGHFNEEKIASLVLEISQDFETPDLGLALGFNDADMSRMLGATKEVTFNARMGGERDDSLKYSVIVSCDDEDHQTQLLEQLEKKGLKCKPLVS